MDIALQKPTPKTPRSIRVLPSEVAEKIAAGEVIERPASIVKELVENSLDAGATDICVSLESGGKGLIEVLDNGYGMSAKDLALALERHATSKLRELSDLEQLHTLGFRGEALPSIAAVSHMSLVSRALGEETAYELKPSANARSEPIARSLNKITFGHFLGSTHGTLIRVEGLFSQMPARLKFLRSEGAEVAQVREWLERLAIANCGTGFTLLSHDRKLLQLQAEEEATRVQWLLSEGEDFPILREEISDPLDPTLRLHAFWLQGLSLPHTRRLAQVVNGRSVRDRLLQQAMLSGFKQALLPGRFPAVALFVDLPPAFIDVNVHPTKTEVRFMDPSKIFHLTQKLMEKLLSNHGAPAFVGGTFPVQKNWTNGPNENAGLWRAAEYHDANLRGTQAELILPSSRTVATPVDEASYVGPLFQTYLLFEAGEELILIDQHAAHERIRFESLRKQVFSGGSVDAQQLLIPEPVKFEPAQRPRLESRLSWLFRLGFEADLFGEDTLLFRALPSAWGEHQLRIRLKSLVERVLDESTAPEILSWDERLFEKLASEACHSAVRAGDRLQPEQARAIVQDLFTCEHPWNCPHGRPTVVKIPKIRFEEWFQRKI